MQQDRYGYLRVEGMTDRGCKRKENEDWLGTFECETGLVAVVSDGMGGHVGGKIASHTAVDAIEQWMKQHPSDDPRRAIRDAIDEANRAVMERAEREPELRGMGATCVMLIVRDGKVYFGSVGDSRIYLVRGKTIKRLTKDQSFVQILVDAGEITEEEAEHHPRKNEITNAIGLRGMEPATVCAEGIDPEAGDIFLLCSDGLSGMVDEREILRIVSQRQEMTQQERVNALIEKAKIDGGLDNITVQTVEFSIAPSSTHGGGGGSRGGSGGFSHRGESIGKKGLIAGGIVILGALLVLGGWLCKKHRAAAAEETPSETVAEAPSNETEMPVGDEKPLDNPSGQRARRLGEFVLGEGITLTARATGSGTVGLTWRSNNNIKGEQMLFDVTVENIDVEALRQGYNVKPSETSTKGETEKTWRWEASTPIERIVISVRKPFSEEIYELTGTAREDVVAQSPKTGASNAGKVKKPQPPETAAEVGNDPSDGTTAAASPRRGDPLKIKKGRDTLLVVRCVEDDGVKEAGVRKIGKDFTLRPEEVGRQSDKPEGGQWAVLFGGNAKSVKVHVYAKKIPSEKDERNIYIPLKGGESYVIPVEVY